MAKVLCVLYEDPQGGYPQSYARRELPDISHYPNGQPIPNPQHRDFVPGSLLGSVSGALGLRSYLENLGHEFIVTADKDGADSVFEKNLIDADVVISQPFWPAYLTADRIAKAKNLKLVITAGIGSDHIDLEAAIAKGITVAD
jgi:formate dehydrogenase